MSLINEALKKAQHQRTGSALDAPPMPGGGSGGSRGRSGMPTGTLVLLIAGAAVVVVISVVATVYFVNRPSAPKVAVAAPAPAPMPAPTPAPAPAAEPVVEGTLADRIANYVDKVRVTGIRTSENGSKVLMNDRVYRLNDLVDRKLGLRLVKIESDSLTFADATGATYVKSF